MATYLSRIVAVSVDINPTPATYGAGSSPLLNSAIHQFRNTTPVALDTTVINLQELRQSFSKTSDAVGRQLYRLTPGLVLMGPGSPTSPMTSASVTTGFRLGKILRMCGMSESISATSGASSITYTFRSSGFEDGLVDCHLGDTGTGSLQYKMKGVYGTLTMAGSAGQVITVDPTLTGIISAQPSSATAVSTIFPSAGNTAQTMSVEALSIKASGVTYSGGTALKFKSFSLDLGIDVQEDSDANANYGFGGLLIAGRSPTLQLTVGADPANVQAFHADLLSGYAETITFLHGSGHGKQCRFTMKGQLQSVTQADDVGLRTLQLQYNLVSNTDLAPGADESELKLEFF